MLTQEQVLSEIKGGRKSRTLTGRDYDRLSGFFPHTEWEHFGFKLKEDADISEIPEPIQWTEENILSQLKNDLAFAFEKALDKRGISAGEMYEVVKMWMWILQNPLKDEDLYAQYGLPYLKAVALAYGLPNEIGEDNGDEYKYSSESDD